MEIRVLGPVELYDRGGRVDLGPRKQRFVLGVLALEVDHLVTVDRLVQLTWPEGAPRTAVHAIQVIVSRLRALGINIETRGDGYVLHAEVDAARFIALLELAAATDDDERRVAVLTEAIDLWTGPALSGVGAGEALTFGLAEARLSAIEDRIDARLRLGQHREVRIEVGDLVGAHPTRERLIGQLMTCLYRSGHVREALDVYRTARESLADRFGLDPGAELQRLELAILRSDPSLDGPVRRAAKSNWPLPQQLPTDVGLFTGRQRELAALDDVHALTVVSGTGGIGKTTLVVRWAHTAAQRFPDGQLYVNLRGFDPTDTAVEPVEAVRGFLEALGVPGDRIPSGLPAQAALYRSMLSGKRVLVVLDNARDAEHVRPLLPGSATCLVVITSRDRCAPLVITEGAHLVPLDLLEPAEAREFLVNRLGAKRVDGETAAADDVIASCARLPLALAIAAARAAMNPGFSLAALADELREASTGLDALRGGDAATDVRAVFALSYRRLTEDAARLFRLLGLHGAGDIGERAAASLAALSFPRARALLGELTTASLLTEHAPGRYAFHDLLRAYAAERARGDEPDDARRAAVRRLLDHYLHPSHRAATLLDPGMAPLSLDPPAADVVTVELTTDNEALAWFDAESDTLFAAIQLAAETGFGAHVWQLAWAVNMDLVRRGRWADNDRAQLTALAAARRLDDLAGQAHAALCLAIGYLWSGRLDVAEAPAMEALERFEKLDDRANRARTLNFLAMATGERGDLTGALTWCKRALEVFRELGHPRGVAAGLNNVAWSQTRLGHHTEALASCEEAILLLEAFEYREGEAATSHTIGYIYRQLGDHERSLAAYEAALAITREFGHRADEADTLADLADTYESAGDTVAARRAWRQALTILDELEHPDADRLREKLGGEER